MSETLDNTLRKTSGRVLPFGSSPRRNAFPPRRVGAASTAEVPPGDDIGGREVHIVRLGGDANDDVSGVLAKLPGVRVLAHPSGGSQLAQLIRTHHVDLVLLSLDSSPGRVLAAVATLAEQRGDIRFCAVASQTDADLILSALRAGVTEFIRLPREEDRLRAVLGALGRRTVSSPKRAPSTAAP